jgi:hypothetical protein
MQVEVKKNGREYEFSLLKLFSGRALPENPAQLILGKKYC